MQVTPPPAAAISWRIPSFKNGIHHPAFAVPQVGEVPLHVLTGISSFRGSPGQWCKMVIPSSRASWRQPPGRPHGSHRR